MGGKGQAKGAGKEGKAAPHLRNWRCDLCGNTDNCAWWTQCGRATCKAGKPEPKPQWKADDKWDSWSNWSPSGWVDYQAAPVPPDQMLRAARDNLKAVAAIFPPGHAAVTEVAQQVHVLEEAQKVAVPTSEKLRCLLHEQKELEAKQTESVTLVTQAAEAVRTATAALKVQMTWREEVDRNLATNKLDVAALTRDVTAPGPAGPTSGDVVQSLRARVDILSDNDFTNGNFAKSELVTFFQAFAKLVAVVDHAELRESAVEAGAGAAAGAAPAPAPAGATTVGGVEAAMRANQVEALATNTGLSDDATDDDEDDEGDKHMGDGDAAALAAMEEADSLLTTTAEWSATLSSTPVSCG